MTVEQLDREISEMLFKAGAPISVNFISRLQDTALFFGNTAANQSRMASMLARQKMDHDRGFAVLTKAQDDAAILPIHR